MSALRTYQLPGVYMRACAAGNRFLFVEFLLTLKSLGAGEPLRENPSMIIFERPVLVEVA
jgi:hypothetical protein